MRALRRFVQEQRTHLITTLTPVPRPDLIMAVYFLNQTHRGIIYKLLQMETLTLVLHKLQEQAAQELELTSILLCTDPLILLQVVVHQA